VPCHRSCVASIRPALVHLVTGADDVVLLHLLPLTSQPSSLVVVVARPEGIIDMPRRHRDMTLGQAGVSCGRRGRRSFGSQ
jgi:hypothetical protein